MGLGEEVREARAERVRRSVIEEPEDGGAEEEDEDDDDDDDASPNFRSRASIAKQSNISVDELKVTFPILLASDQATSAPFLVLIIKCVWFGG